MTATTPVNGQSEDLQTLLKEMTTLKEEARLEKSKNTDVDCEYLYVRHHYSLLLLSYSELYGSQRNGRVPNISRHEYEESQGHERPSRENTPLRLVA